MTVEERKGGVLNEERMERMVKEGGRLCRGAQNPSNAVADPTPGPIIANKVNCSSIPNYHPSFLTNFLPN